MEYIPDLSFGFQRSSQIDSRPNILVSVMYGTPEVPRDTFWHFSEITGFKWPLPPYWDKAAMNSVEDWAGIKNCHASYMCLLSLFERAMKLPDVGVINF